MRSAIQSVHVKGSKDRVIDAQNESWLSERRTIRKKRSIYKVAENDAILRLFAKGHTFAQHMSAPPMATSCTQAVNEESGANAREASESATSSQGTAPRRKMSSMRTSTEPERLVPPTPLPGSTLGPPRGNGYSERPTIVVPEPESPGKTMRMRPLRCRAAYSRNIRYLSLLLVLNVLRVPQVPYEKYNGMVVALVPTVVSGKKVLLSIGRSHSFGSTQHQLFEHQSGGLA